MVYKKNIDCQRLGNKVCFRTSHKPLNKIFAEFFLRHTCVRPAAFRTLPKGQISVVRTDIYDGIDKNISHIKVKANRINRYMERYPSPQYLSQVSPTATVWPRRNILRLSAPCFQLISCAISCAQHSFCRVFLLVYVILHYTQRHKEMSITVLKKNHSIRYSIAKTK